MNTVIKILLADLSYQRSPSQLATATPPSPLATPTPIGRIASYIKKEADANVEITLVKDPDHFYDIINHNDFHIAGFSQYCWNARLSQSLAWHLKKLQQDCITVFGGPQLPIDAQLQEEYVRKYDFIDFFIEKEGEGPFTHLISSLDANNLNIEKTKLEQIPSVRSLSKDGQFITSPLAQRIMELDAIPSPFVAGLMDQFMESGFTPLIVTNKGCPFRCEFCGEGDLNLSKIACHSVEYLQEEFEYIARKMVQLGHHPFPDLMYFADSNSGMYKQDLEIYARFGEIQKKYGYPKSIITSTGKNVKSRVIEAIKLLNGAISLTASVQSTDAEVLKSIKRENISVTDIKVVA